jgi:hypothetical protein
MPATVSAKDLALSNVLLVIIKLTCRCFNDFATRLAPSPEPMSIIRLFFKLSKYCSAKFTASDPIETLPLFRPVLVLILLPSLSALSNIIERLEPA